MRLLVISNLYPPAQIGGYEMGCRELAENLVARGHEVLVLTGAAPYPDIEGPVAVHRGLHLSAFRREIVNGSAGAQAFHDKVSQAANTRTMLAAIRRFAPDRVYLFNLVGLGGLGLLAALRIAEVPWVWHLMDRVPVDMVAGVPRSVLEIMGADHGRLWQGGTVISMSDNLIDEVEECTGWEFVRRPSLVPGWAAPVAEGHRPYRDGGVTRFVSAGTLSTVKGVDLILEAASALRRAEPAHPFTVDVFGTGDSLHYAHLIHADGLDDIVRIRGPRSRAELIEEYRRADAFLFPTWSREPFGFAPIEAASVGCVPVITADCGAAERLVDGVHAVKITRSAQALTSAMRDIVQGRTDLERIGARARRICREALSLEAAVTAVERILEEGGPWRPDARMIERAEALASFTEAVAVGAWNQG
ncbi:MAG: glycosyltransferase family 4 protein [Protaetiibacter sp.]